MASFISHTSSSLAPDSESKRTLSNLHSESPNKKIKQNPHPISTIAPSAKFPASPEKNRNSYNPLTTTWNSFIPLNLCSMPFELPVSNIQLVIAKINKQGVLAPNEIQAGILEKIVELAHILLPNNFVHYKKNTPLQYPVEAHKGESDLPCSFFIVSQPDKIYACISSPLLVGKGTTGKVTRATGLVFNRIRNGVQFEGKLDAVKFTMKIVSPAIDPEDTSVNKAKMRIQAAVDLFGIPHVINPYFHGLLKGKNLKVIMMYKRYSSDLFAYHELHAPTPSMRRLNTRTIAEQIGKALRGIHLRGYVHRDVKEENLLVRWDSEELLETVGLNDFDLATPMKSSNSTLSQTCGTMQYAAPEMLAKAFELDEYFQALKVEDAITLLGPGLDTWGYGLILHRALYDRFPEHVYLMIDYEATLNCLKDAETQQAEETFKNEAKEIKYKWLTVMLKGIKEASSTCLTEDITLESFIDNLLQIDPRKRPSDDNILESLAKLKL